MANVDDTAPKKRNVGHTSMAVWLLMAMLVTGLGGWGVTNFGRSVTAIGSVGSQEIDVNDYSRALRNQINALSKKFGQQLTLKEAQIFGADQQALQSLISNAALNNEGARIGVSVGNAAVAKQVSGLQGFQDVTGKFDRVTYQQVLQQNNRTVRDFEAGVRKDIARQVLQAAVVGGIVAPDALTATIYAFSNETRGFSLLHLTEAGLTQKLPAPTDAEIKTYYDAHIADFTRPEAKKVTYILLDPATLAKDMKIEDAAIKADYDARKSDYSLPEKRLVERLVFPSDAEAAAAKARLDKGESFETIVKERGLALTDIDMGDVAKSALGKAGDAVFAMTEPGITGPLPSDLGPALFRMNGILAAQITTLEQASPKILADLQLKAAQKAVNDKAQAVDDTLAGGGKLEDIAKTEAMTLTSFDYAPGADDNDPIATDANFIKVAGKARPGDYPESFGLKDGALAALRVDATVPPTPVPLDKAHDKVLAAFHTDALHKALAAQADAAKTAVSGGASLSAQGIVDVVHTTTRAQKLDNIPANVVKAAFTMKPGDLQVINLPGYVALLRLDSITAAATTGDAALKAMADLSTQAGQSIAQDAYALFSTAMVTQGGLTVDQTAINSVQAQMNR